MNDKYLYWGHDSASSGVMSSETCDFHARYSLLPELCHISVGLMSLVKLSHN